METGRTQIPLCVGLQFSFPEEGNFHWATISVKNCKQHLKYQMHYLMGNNEQPSSYLKMINDGMSW